MVKPGEVSLPLILNPLSLPPFNIGQLGRPIHAKGTTASSLVLKSPVLIDWFDRSRVDPGNWPFGDGQSTNKHLHHQSRSRGVGNEILARKCQPNRTEGRFTEYWYETTFEKLNGQGPLVSDVRYIHRALLLKLHSISS